MTKPTKKTNKNEDHELERGDPLYSEIAEWLQECRDSHDSSSHEPLEPTPTVKGIYPAPDIHEHFAIHNGYGKLRTSSRTTSTTLSTLRLIA